jgi:hypothetical protein
METGYILLERNKDANLTEKSVIIRKNGKKAAM